MIGRVSAVQPGLFLDVLRVRGLRGGRLEVPVAPVDAIYARFEHIRGVPAPEGGMSMFKLQVLDRLIDRLLAEGRPAPEAGLLSRLTPAQAETLIGDLAARLRTRLAGLAGLFGGFAPETGMLLDLQA